MMRGCRTYLLTLLSCWLWCGVVSARPFLSVTRYTSESGDNFGPNVRGLVQDRKGVLWISSFGGLSRFDGTRFLRYKPTMQEGLGQANDRIDELKISPEGLVLCKMMDSYCSFDPVREIFRRDESLAAYFPESVQDSSRRVLEKYGVRWLVDPSSGEVLYHDPIRERYLPPDNPYHNDETIRGCFIDAQDGIWFTGDRWIDHIVLGDAALEPRHDLCDNEVRVFCPSSDGGFWTGSRDGRIMHFDSSLVRTGNLSAAGTLSEDERVRFSVTAIYALLEDSRGRLWIGDRHDGLFRLSPREPGRYSVYHYPAGGKDGISNESIFSLAEDCQGRIWAATFGGGVNILDGNRVLHCLGDAHVREIQPLPDGTLLVSAREGLYVSKSDFAPETGPSFKHNHSLSRPDHHLPGDDVMGTLQTRDGTVWVATGSGGVCRVLSSDLYSDTLSFQAISSRNGLASDLTLSLTEDDAGYLWVSGERGLSRIDPTRGTVMVLNESDFPMQITFSQARPLRYGGNILWGTLEGMGILDVSKIQQDEYSPSVIVTERRFGGQVLTGVLPGNEISLARDERDLTLRFAAIDYRDRSRIRYACQLIGVDKDRVQASDNTVTYLNLPPGKSELLVRATNASGVWADKDTRFIIDVEPYFRETLGGRLLFYGLVLAVLCLIFLVVFRAVRLNTRLKMEEELTETKLKYFTDISHELRTPLTLVDGPISEVLEDETLSDRSRSYLQTAQSNTRLLLDLVSQILDFRKMQSGKTKLMLERTDVLAELQTVAGNFREMAMKHDMSLTVGAQEDIPLLWVDRDKFDKIFFNLISNAFKYSPDGREIRVSAAREGQLVRIRVQDQGVGIRKDEIPTLFERFETASSADGTRLPSSGLGLSLVKQFTELHGGQVIVESEPGLGSTFTVTFPMGREAFAGRKDVEFIASDGVSAGTQEAVPPVDEPAGGAPGLPKVLVAEDNQELRSFIREILSGEYKVLEAGDGDEALALGRAKWPDLLITDIMMPGMDGLELIRRFKGDSDLYQVPVIALTAKSSIDDRVEGIRSGADDYISKPFSVSYLRAKADALIEQRRELRRRLLESMTGGVDLESIEPVRPSIPPADERFIQDLLAFVEQNIDNAEFTIDDFASALNMSRTVFYNKVRSIVGCSPVEFVTQIRLKRAAQLLDASQMNVSEIAYASGFNDPRYFARCFKKKFGMSASVYRSRAHPDK